MRRMEFSRYVWRLLKYAEDCGYDTIGNHWKRSDIEQKELFKKGLSKCDGIEKVSEHQYGKAIDIWIMVEGKISNDRIKYIKLHKYWESLNPELKSMIPWDMGHFE